MILGVSSGRKMVLMAHSRVFSPSFLGAPFGIAQNMLCVFARLTLNWLWFGGAGPLG
jgi:hypothetical protein